MGCLSCEELETKICDLAEALATTACGITVREGDITLDNTPELDAKKEALRTYRLLYVEKRCGDVADFGELMSSGCTSQSKCTTDRCRKSRRGVRRY